MATMANNILSKITVVDMTEGVAGPYAATMLGDMGANVIKVERQEGDWSRTAGTGSHGNIGSAHFITLNRNKRDLGLDIRAADGMPIMQRLVSRADVVISNFRPGAMAKLGLDYDQCKALNPDIVYCTVSGFGQEGPYSKFPASDTIMQSVSGVMNMVGEADGPPLRVGFPLVDTTAANHAVQAILLALYAKLAGQRGGANIDISLMAAAMSLMNVNFTDYLISGKTPQRHGNQNASLAPAGAFKVAGGRYVTVAVLRDSHWKKFCAAMNLEHLENDERFRSNTLRVGNRKALDEIIEPMFLSQSSAYWLERLRAADILCGPINTFADIADDPALASRLPLIDPRVPGVSRTMGIPIRFNGEYFGVEQPPPAKGQHTREILAELEFTPDEIEGFFRSGTAFSAAG